MYTITALYAGLLALILVVLSARVIRGRVTDKISLGDGGGTFSTRLVAHGNLIEFVPLALILIGLLE
jgi:uncharacterized membrane protein YecN with MAPEG domain